MPRRAFCSDLRKVWSQEAAFSVDAMARRAAVLLVDDRACRGVACGGLRRPLPAQLPHVCDHAPNLGFWRTERAWHFRVGNAIADNQENFAVGAAVSKPACVQSGATSPFAVLAMTVTAPADIELAPGFQVRCCGVWVCFREAGPRRTCRSLRLHCKRPTHQTVGDQKYSSHKKSMSLFTSVESKSDEDVTNWNRDQLLASAEEGNRAGEDAIPPVEMPELLARGSVKSIEVPAWRGRKDQVPCSRKRPCPGWRQDAMLPFYLSRLRRHGKQTSPAFLGPETGSTASATAEVGFAWSEFRGVGFKVTPPFLARIEIKELCVGIVAGRHPVVAAVHAGPDQIIAFVGRILIRVENRTALFINLLRPGLPHILFGQQEGARYTVEDIMETVAAG